MTNGKVRVLVADDEPLARERLAHAARAGGLARARRRVPDRHRRHRRHRPSGARPRLPRRADARRQRIRSHRSRRRRAHAARRLRHRLRSLRAARVRRPRARLPAQAVRPPALPRGARRAPGSILERPSNGDLERRLLELVQDLKPTRAEARAVRHQVGRPRLLRARRPRSTGSKPPATTSSCTSAPRRTSSAKR